MNITEIVADLNVKIEFQCLNHCNAKCCRIGRLLISDQNAPLLDVPLKKRDDGYFELSLEPHCPKLLNNKCTIHKESHKPKMCSEFPFFLKGTKLFLASFCPAIKNEVFKEELKDAKNIGVEIIVQ